MNDEHEPVATTNMCSGAWSTAWWRRAQATGDAKRPTMARVHGRGEGGPMFAACEGNEYSMMRAQEMPTMACVGTQVVVAHVVDKGWGQKGAK